ncbi:MAG: hypothetical protein CMQ24_06930 [Gammaproteobacteria bacterium]|nr:hypothetical protein [Gammaproteobacteria bacterium]
MMPRANMLRAIAGAEMLSTRRLARYWVFVVISLLLGVFSFGQLIVMHGLFSHMSATVGTMSPRFLIANSGLNLMLGFLTGLIFIAYDVRARDVRERMSEVLDARPFTNLEALLGRGIGLTLMAWYPILGILLLMQLFGFAAGAFGWPFGEPVEPWSLLGFLIYALTTMALWCAIILLLAMAVRFRILVAVGALALIGLQIWVVITLPLGQSQFYTIVPTFDLASDLVTNMLAEGSFFRLTAQFALAGGCLALAIGLHPRSDDGNRNLRMSIGAALVVAGVAVLGLQKLQFDSGQSDFARWTDAHRAIGALPVPDVQRVEGDVTIEPGGDMQLDLTYTVRGRGQHDSLVFTLNPGLTPGRITVKGSPAQHTFEGGLLQIDSPLANGAETTVRFEAGGTLETTFGYLDSSLDMLSGNAADAQIALLGTDVSLNKGSYVALMPGGFWMPTAGPAVPSSNPRTHPVDHFEVDLSVGVPEGWLVAGPGRRDADGARFRFSPPQPVAPFGLFASRFERLATTVRGVTFELLIHPTHTRTLASFSDLGDAIAADLDEALADAERLGLPYPYRGLSLVEIPNRLRGYAGDWRLDTTQSLPGVMLLRETGFPTSRFKIAFRNEEALHAAEASEDGIEGYKMQILERFFENDFSGGNVFLGASRNFFAFQTSARGDGALALNFVLEELVNLVLTGRRGYFSAHEYNSGTNVLLGRTMTELGQGRTESVADAITRAATDRPSVWDRALGHALSGLDPEDEPGEVLNVLSLKCRAVAQTILDGLGEEDTARLLATLLERHRGGLFTQTDFNHAAASLGVDVDALLGDWLNDAALPGFLVSGAEGVRLNDDGNGNPRYQTTFHIRNDEAVPGLLRVRYLEQGEGDIPWITEGPFRVAGKDSIEIGIVSSMPLAELIVSPYLALNRTEIQLSPPRIDAEKQLAGDAFIGFRPSTWQPAPSQDVIVDDLDPGFTVAGGPKEPPSRGPFVAAPDLDQGLPEYEDMFGMPPVWSRAPRYKGFGKYRHTLAIIRAGEGEQKAIFRGELPHSGRWRVAIYIAEDFGPEADTALRGALGEYSMSLVASGERTPIEFDAAAAEPGWNPLGEFRFAAGDASIEITNETNGRAIIADAVRWRPITEAK